MVPDPQELSNIDFAIWLYKRYAKQHCCNDCNTDDAGLTVELTLAAITCDSTLYYQPLKLLAEHIASNPRLVTEETKGPIKNKYPANVRDAVKALKAKQRQMSKKMIPCFVSGSKCPPPICMTPIKLVPRDPCEPCSW